LSLSNFFDSDNERLNPIFLLSKKFDSDNEFLIYIKNVKTINVPLFKKLRDNLRGQKSLGPLKMSLEMAHKVIVPQKKIRSQS
jgi:hypothetical protein